ncbi:hypothetical protein IFM89_034493 [Coptis chinensis]|uniref:Uncharacterized protein n=1 Tax=Coptis chinensis TaxID=261450 RepID=A0A835LQ01_9MAGN|nr:hypothetical protein IFM89_034493 [Coptis chinensis]
MLHTEPEQIGPNYFAYYRNEFEQFFSQNVNHGCKGKEPLRTLFANGIADSLSDFKKERFKASLKQTVTALTQEVDEMLEPVLAMYEIKKHLSDKERVANNPHSDEYYTSPSPYKKQKLSSSPSSNGVATNAGAFGTETYEGASGSEDKDSKYPRVVSSEESRSRSVK